jgi:peptide/nickel transport system permease protein
VHGARATLATSAGVALIALLVGSTVGAVAGYLGGFADEVLMRIADATQTVPPFVLALALVSVAGPTQPVIVAALAAGAWTGPARVVRAQVLSLRERPFVEASRLLGRSPLAVAVEVVLPNALGPIIALASVIVAGAILAEAALSFLGLGDPNRASWGALIAEGRSVLRTAPHVIFAPGLAVTATVLAVSLAGEGLAKALARPGQE